MKNSFHRTTKRKFDQERKNFFEIKIKDYRLGSVTW